MAASATRRRFLQSAAAGGAALGLADFCLLDGLPPVSAKEAALSPDAVRFGPDIEPTVRFLEETPRDTLLEQIVARLKKDLSYRELLAALLLAGIRNIPGADLASHRNVGGELHSVLVVNSAHLASLASADGERLLPLLWSVDQYKKFRARPHPYGIRRPPWHMRPVDESAVPPASKASGAFIAALDKWDEEAADPAAAAMARTAGAHEVFATLSRYAARDFRYIGHKVIYVANAWRTLRTIGWQHAEPVIRSLARALTAYFHSEGHPSRTDQLADRSWRHNHELAATIRDGWQIGKQDAAAATDLLVAFREQNDLEAADVVVALLNRQVDPQTVWDAVFAGMAEQLMIQPGFNTLHAVTTANALHFVYQTCGDDETRRRLLLQAASFVPLFGRDVAKFRRTPLNKRVDLLKPRPLDGDAHSALEEIFAAAGKEPLEAAEKTMAYLAGGGDARALMARARRLVFRKGDNHHDYKYSSAVLEDYLAISPAWRDRFLAAAMFQLRGSGGPDTPLAERLKSTA